jgi:hypothetical protein
LRGRDEARAAEKGRSPDEAKRNPGATIIIQQSFQIPDFASAPTGLR